MSRSVLAALAAQGCPLALVVRAQAWLASWPGPPPAYAAYLSHYGEACLAWAVPGAARWASVWVDRVGTELTRSWGYYDDGTFAQDEGPADERQAVLAAWLHDGWWDDL